MGNKHKTMLPVRLFFNLNNSGLESCVSIHRHGNCVGFETPTDCQSFQKGIHFWQRSTGTNRR